MIEISKLSVTYQVRRLDESDIDSIRQIYEGNELFLSFGDSIPIVDRIYADMHIIPSGMHISSKYFLGYLGEDELVAVVDLVDGYPEPETVYVGLFMVDATRQGRGLGSALTAEMEACLKERGTKRIRLAINKGNPQATHFWTKNGYRVFREASKSTGVLLEAEKEL